MTKGQDLQVQQDLSDFVKAPEGIRRLYALALTVAAIALWPLAAAADSAGEQVKAIAKRYTQVEEQLPRSIRYAQRAQTGDGAVVKQAWFNGTGDLLKVATEHAGPQGRELTEFTQTDPGLAFDGCFVFTRKEMPAPEGGTDVEETRSYFGQATYRDQSGIETTDNGILVRELRKSAHFAPGEPLDLAKTSNTTVAVPQPPEADRTEDEEKARRKFFEEPAEIARALPAAGPPESDPFAGVQGDSGRFRLIRRSASPDGRYAIAIGFKQAVDWSTFADTFFGDEEIYTVENAEGLQNYLVELPTKTILGVTGGEYFGTRQRYNHRESTVVWSNDSSIFVQEFSSKWSYESCHAGRISAGPKLSGTVDLGKAAEQHARSFLKRKGRKFEGSIALSFDEVKDDGTIVLQITGQSPSVPNKGEVYFRLKETLRLSGKGRPELAFVKARLLPND